MTFEAFPTHALMEITARPPLVFVRGEGSWLWDHEGKRYSTSSRAGPSTASGTALPWS
jgi:acetylornithine/succinyldiaminopimelate/putrescine aminotransferase